MSAPRIAIVGTGANGVNMGVDLVRAGYEVPFIDQWPANLEEVRSNGVQIVMPHQTLQERIDIFHI